LSHDKVAELLVAARGKSVSGLAEIERGFWGDIRLMFPHIVPGPGGWTRAGSGECLDQLFLQSDE
jgi:hypothetical protein